MKGLWSRFITKAPEEVPEEVSRVYTQLYGLQHSRHFAWVQLGDNKTEFQSMVLNVDMHERQIILDEPFGLPHTFYWTPGMSVQVLIKDYVKRIEFTSRFVKLEPVEDEHQLIVTWPKEVFSDQRRQEYRVAFDNFDRVPLASIGNQTAEPVPILDLSSKGIGLAIPSSLSDQLYIDQKLEAELCLNAGVYIHADLKVLRLEGVEDNSVMCVGSALEAHTPRDQRILEKFLAAAQRKQLRGAAV